MPKYSDGGRFARVHESVQPSTYGIQWPKRLTDGVKRDVTVTGGPAPKGRTRAQRRAAARRRAMGL